ncbi:MAG: hypothetical protein M0R46_14280 [Candidatus Muirbacterium halophilum]|nr:hypothetical protein [Candidatus Muirbacterium halophilum]MCK9477089.1 hypothetical protein [Candidatus Muirbacterium halophilum]
MKKNILAFLLVISSIVLLIYSTNSYALFFLSGLLFFIGIELYRTKF